MVSIRQKAIAGMRWTGASAVITTVLQLAQLGILANRFLEPDDFGLMAMIMVVIGFAQAFGDVGISNAIIHRQNATRDELSSLYWLNLGAGITVFLAVWAATPAIVALYDEPRLGELVFWLALMFAVIPIGQQFQVLLEKDLRFRSLACIDVAATATATLTAIGCASIGHGVWSLVWGQLAWATIRSLLLLGVGWRDSRPALHFRRSDLDGYLRFGLFQMGERTANYLSANLDKLLIGALLGPRLLGLYSVVYRLMLRPMQILNPVVTRVAFPVFARLQDDDARLRKGYAEAVTVIALFLTPIYAGLIAVAEPFLLFLLGEEWRPAIPVFQVLCGLGVIYSLNNPMGSLLLAKGRAELGFWFNLFRVALYAMAVLAGSQYGLIGIATALLLATAAVLLPLTFHVRWIAVRMRAMEYLSPVAPMLLLSTCMAGCVIALGAAVGPLDPPLTDLIFLSASGAALYVSGLLLWRRQNVLEIMRSLWIRDG